MSLYLIHCPIIYWIKVFLHGKVGLAVIGKEPELEFPPWPAIPLHILTSILAAALLTIFFEEPIRKFIRFKTTPDYKSN